MSQPEPLILGFDTSSAHCGAAVLRAGQIVAARDEPMTKGQSERLFPMIDEVLADAGAGLGDLEAIGVGIGPGNFTGIRIAVSAARGLALSLNIPAVGVSLFDALSVDTEGPLLRTISAPRGRVYALGPSDITIRQAAIEELPKPPAGTIAIGERADEVAAHLGIPHRPAALAPAAAIARVAATRWQEDVRPPAPLYVRAADAAPSRTVAPEITP